MIALLWSCNAPATISEADAEPLFISTTNGISLAIVSTPKGVMTDIDARKQKIGGEIICKVF